MSSADWYNEQYNMAKVATNEQVYHTFLQAHLIWAANDYEDKESCFWESKDIWKNELEKRFATGFFMAPYEPDLSMMDEMYKVLVKNKYDFELAKEFT